MTDLKTETITGGRPGSGAHRVVALCGPYLSGKTSLLESILYATGAIGRRGSTRAGTSIGDAAAEARKRGMGTEINVASVDYLGDQWTFLDVPGSIEFQHDAFAALAVCDVAVVVCEPSPERVVALAPLLKYIEDRHIPHIIFVNKIDSAEVRVRDMLSALQSVSTRKLVLRQVPIRRPTNDGGEETVGYVDLVSERAYRYKSSGASDLIEMPAEILPREAEARRELLETLSEFDDTLLEQLIEDIAPEKSLIYRDLHDEFGADQIVPVLLGAGDRENGVRRLLKALRHDTPFVGETAKRRVPRRPTAAAMAGMLQGPAPGARRQALALPGLVGNAHRRPVAGRPSHRHACCGRSASGSTRSPKPGAGETRGAGQGRGAVGGPDAGRGAASPPSADFPAADAAGVRAVARRQEPQRRGQALGRPAQDRRGGSVAFLRGARRDPRAAAQGPGRDASQGGGRQAGRPLQRRRRDGDAARGLSRDHPGRRPAACPLQAPDRRPRPVRRHQGRDQAAAARLGLPLRRQDRGRRGAAQLHPRGRGRPDRLPEGRSARPAGRRHRGHAVRRPVSTPSTAPKCRSRWRRASP